MKNNPFNPKIETMTLAEATENVKKMASNHGGKLQSTVAFDLGEGTIFLDDTVSPTEISNESKEAECTIKIDLENFEKLMSGDLNPMMAFMTGKMKVEGDKGIAMKMSSMF